MHHDEPSRWQCKSISLLLIVIVISIAAGRIAVVSSAEGDTAFLSANDRSRWCTVASLVEDGTYVIDRQIAITDPRNRNRHPWGTIDKVHHTGADGNLHHYSSKPPLFPTMVAGVYKLVNLFTGMTMTDQPIYLPRIILALVNLPMLILFLLATIGVIDRVCDSDWGRFVGAASTCFATMLLPFSLSLNNHLPAATATAVAMWIYVIIAERFSNGEQCVGSLSRTSFWCFAAGVASAFAAANELPALSMMFFWLLLFAMLDRSTMVPLVAGMAVVAIGFFATNWIAHQSLRPPYAHRGNGASIAEFPATETDQHHTIPSDQVQSEIKKRLVQGQLVAVDAELQIRPSAESGRWVVQADETMFALLRKDRKWVLAQWDDWYEYPGTYWQDGQRRGVDLGEPSRWIYFVHLTIGHHGIFSLTPIWLLLPIGLAKSLLLGPADWRRLAFAVLLATVVCVAFYVSRSMIDRNYGGISVCFRWLLWFAPLWLAMIAPILDEFNTSPTRRRVTLALLAWSVFSMSTALGSPWQSPWLYRFWRFLGWIEV